MNIKLTLSLLAVSLLIYSNHIVAAAIDKTESKNEIVVAISNFLAQREQFNKRLSELSDEVVVQELLKFTDEQVDETLMALKDRERAKRLKGLIENEKAEECGICFCNFTKLKEDNTELDTYCTHRYHEECLTQWFARSSKRCCITCQAPVIRDVLNALYSGRSVDYNKIEEFINAGMDINLLIDGQTLLTRAVKLRDFRLIEMLLVNKAKVNMPDIDGLTPLMHAVYAKRQDIVELLLKNKADLNDINPLTDETALPIAH